MPERKMQCQEPRCGYEWVLYPAKTNAGKTLKYDKSCPWCGSKNIGGIGE